MDKSHNLLMMVLVVVVLVSGVSLGYAATHVNATPSAKAVSLTLVISPYRYFNNSTGDAPSYFILDNGQLQSAEYIYLPQYSTIDLTIIDWDNGSSSVSTQYANVSGTYNNQVAIFSNTTVNDTSMPQSGQSAWVTSAVELLKYLYGLMTSVRETALLDGVALTWVAAYPRLTPDTRTTTTRTIMSKLCDLSIFSLSNG